EEAVGRIDDLRRVAVDIPLPRTAARLRLGVRGTRRRHQACERDQNNEKPITNHAVERIRRSYWPRGISEEYHGPATPGPARSGRSIPSRPRAVLLRTRA